MSAPRERTQPHPIELVGVGGPLKTASYSQCTGLVFSTKPPFVSMSFCRPAASAATGSERRLRSTGS